MIVAIEQREVTAVFFFFNFLFVEGGGLIGGVASEIENASVGPSRRERKNRINSSCASPTVSCL